MEVLCQICHNQEASVYLIENMGNYHNTLHICEACAQKKHLGDMLAKPALAIHELLASILELGASPAESQEDLKCPGCGMSFAQFREVGRFGCLRCYETFRKSLLPLLRQFHQAEEHKGRLQPPLPATSPAPNLHELKDQLKKLIAEEKFEQAAFLRDQIRQMEKKDAKNS